MNSKNFRSLCEAYGQVHQPKTIDFEDWVDELIDEGYDLSDYSWDELYEAFNKDRFPSGEFQFKPWGTAKEFDGRGVLPKLNTPPTPEGTQPTTRPQSTRSSSSTKPVLAMRGGVQGVGVGKDWKAQNWNKAETSRYINQGTSNYNTQRQAAVAKGATTDTIKKAEDTGMSVWRVKNPELAKASDARTMTRGTSASTNLQMSGFNRLPTPISKAIGQITGGQPPMPTPSTNPASSPPSSRARGSSKPGSRFEYYNYNLHPEVIEDVTSLYQSIYEGKKKVDQDVDGDKDFADVMIARMVASGVSKEEAIRKVKNKEYNLRNEDISEAAPAIAAAGARLAPMLARLGPAAGRMKPLLKRGAKFVGRGMLDSVMDSNKKEQTPQEKEQENKNQDDDVSNSVKKGLTSMYKMGEEYEMVIGYLIDEGYADSLGAAEIILENMSDEWLDEILNNY